MDDYKSYIDEGINSINEGHFQKAIDVITKSIELKNDWHISYFYRAVANQALGNKEEAILDYTKAIKINDKMTDAYYNRASILLEDKNAPETAIKQAINDLDKALEQDPKFQNALFAMAAAQKRIKDYHKALVYLERLLQIDPEAIFARALKKLILQKYII